MRHSLPISRINCPQRRQRLVCWDYLRKHCCAGAAERRRGARKSLGPCERTRTGALVRAARRADQPRRGDCQVTIRAKARRVAARDRKWRQQCSGGYEYNCERAESQFGATVAPKGCAIQAASQFARIRLGSFRFSSLRFGEKHSGRQRGAMCRPAGERCGASGEGAREAER